MSPPRNGLAIETRGLHKSFADRIAVAGIDLHVPVGSVFGFLGPNGAGKTTLIRMLLGLLRPSGGDAWLFGMPMPRQHAVALRRVGAIVEEPGFHRYLTGRENLWVAATARRSCSTPRAGLPDTRAVERIDWALDRVGLLDRSADRVGGYSLGMRQRLGIARCLLSDPGLLILDEPVNGLDPAGIREMRALIRSFADEGRTVFLSSHLLDEVQRVCDEVAIVDRGRVVLQGPTEALLGTEVLVVGVDDPHAAQVVLARLPEVQTVADNGEGALRLQVGDARAAAAAVSKALADAGVTVSRLEATRASLEDVFLELTSRLGGDR